MSRPKLNILDKAIASVSPSWGWKRLQMRAAMNLYEGASRGKRTANWRTPATSIQADTRKGLTTLRSRARDLAQNNAYAAAAHRELPSNIVGEGITPHVNLPTPEQREQAETLAKMWFDTSACDAQGRMNFYGIQNLVMKTVVESGECLVRRVRRSGPMSDIPLQLQVMEPDHIDTLKDGVKVGNNWVVQGVEYNPQGQRVAYWIYTHHPGDQFYRMVSLESQRIPASEILHIFRVDRAGQVRGVPWGAPVIISLRDFDEYEDAQLVRQKIAACFTAFITPGDDFSLAGDSDQEEGQRLLPESMQPGTIEELGSGKDVTFASPPGVQGYGEYSTVTLHKISTGYGIPYSVLTGDLSKVNFSSARMGDRTFARNVKHWQQNLLIPQLCQPVWAWFMDAAIASRGLADAVPARWAPPRRELTDPAREIPALIQAVRGGHMTQPDLLRQMGTDPDDFIRDLERWNAQLDSNGIVLDSDPRNVSRAGVFQTDNTQEDTDEEASE